MKQFCVSDLFNLPPFHHARLVCGEKGLANAITGLNIIEAPDVAEWLQGGEILLTNLYSLQALQPLDTFIHKLAAKNLSVLIVKIGVFIDAIPDELIKAAEECDLPVIEIKRNVLYRDIAFSVTEKLLDERIALLKYVQEAHECFTDLSVHNASLQQIVDALTKFIGNPVILYDRDFVPLRASNAELMGAKNVPKNAERAPFFSAQYQINEEKELFDQLVYPISVGEVKIKLAVCPKNTPISELHHIAIKNAINALIIELIQQKAVSEVEKRFQSDLLSDLLNGQITSLDAILERASLLQWDLKKPYAVASFALEEANFKKGQKGIDAQRLAYEKLYTLLCAHFPESPMQVRTDQLIMLWGIHLAEGKNWLAAIEAQLAKIISEWHKTQPKIKLQIGIGDMANEPISLAKSFQEAKDTLKIMQNVPKMRAINAYPELGAYRLLLEFPDKNALKSFIPKALQQLIATQNEALIKTLRVYLECDRNMAQAAEALHVHHKTIAYRVEQIKKQSGLTLNDPEEILHLQMGFKILTLLSGDSLSVDDNSLKLTKKT